MNSILAKKIEQGQKFLEDGKRIPVTKLEVAGNIVIGIKTLVRDKYSAVQLGFDKRSKTRPAKSLKSAYNFIREVRMADAEATPAIGDVIRASEIFKPGDVINVTGISKGKGYAGGVKRYHFKGGPRTHGQSDRERAPGSVGSNTTPGRVLKGKRMAGRMGHEQVTVKNLKIVSVDDNFVLIKGLVPGGRNTLLMLKKVGEDKKFIPLYMDKIREESKTEIETKIEEVQKPDEAKKVEEVKKPAEIKGEIKAEVKEDVK